MKQKKRFQMDGQPVLSGKSCFGIFSGKYQASLIIAKIDKYSYSKTQPKA